MRTGDRSASAWLIARSLLVGDAEISARTAGETGPPARQSGYLKLFPSVTQADQGCDFDFLRATAIT